MAEKVFKNKEELNKFIKQQTTLDSTSFKKQITLSDFLNYMNDLYEFMLKKNKSFLYSLDKIPGKIKLRKLLNKTIR